MRTTVRSLKAIRNHPQFNRYLVAAVVTLAVLSGFVIINSFAASTNIVLQAGNTVATGGANINTDSTASNGKVLQFQAQQDIYDLASWLQSEAVAPINPAEGSWPAGSLGNFRFICWPSHLNYDDPIVYPGQQGKAHLHMFFGNRATNYQTTPQNIAAKGDGSCQGGPINRTAYWVPALLDPNGKARLPLTTVFYYKTQGIAKASVQPIPNGLRMISGNPKAMSPQNDWHQVWACYNADGSKVGESYVIPQNCGNGQSLKLQFSFPQCGARNSDGSPTLDSADHKSHMAFQDPYYHTCPSTHPIPYPEISLNMLWKLGAGETTAGWYLSSDKMTMADGTQMNVPGGTTTHADWFMGWNQQVMDTFINRCLREGRNSNQGNLCDGTRLKMVAGPNGGEFTGSRIVDPPSSPTGQVNFASPF